MKAFNANINYLIVFFLLLPIAAVYADSSINFNTMMTALKTNMEPVIVLTKAAGYVLGFTMVISAIMDLKKIGQSQGGAEGALGGPLFRLALGVALIYYPFTISIGNATLTGSSSIQAYPTGSGGQFEQAKQGAVALIQVIGYVSFIRGFITLGHSTKPGSQAGTVGKGVLYVVGGILAINIVTTMQIVGNTLGIAMF